MHLRRPQLVRGSSGVASPEVPSGYDIVARIMTLRADSRYGALMSSTADYMAPNGLELPELPTTTTSVTVTSIEDLNTAAAGSGVEITLSAGSHAGAISIAGQDIDLILTGATVDPPANTMGLTTTRTARRVRVTSGAILAGREIYGQDIKIYGTQFLCKGTFTSGMFGNGGGVYAHRYNGERLTVRNASNGWLFSGPAIEGHFYGSCDGTTLTITEVVDDGVEVEVGQYVVTVAGDLFVNGTRIEEQLDGTPGGAGTYRLNIAHTVSSGTKSLWRRATNEIEANCDIEVPLQPRLVITNMTQTNPVVVTYTGTFDPINSDQANIRQVVGMTEANALSYATIANVNTGANTFELQGVNGTSWTAYESGGIVEATWPEENVSRFNGANFGVVLDSRLAAAEKATQRAHASYTTKEASGVIAFINTQSEKIGTLCSEPGAFGVHPAVENLILDDWRIYRGEDDDTGALLDTPRYSSMSNIGGMYLPSVASITGNGTTATITFDSAHNLGSAAPVAITGATNSGFNTGSTTLTPTGTLTATYPSSESGTAATDATVYLSAGIRGNGTTATIRFWWAHAIPDGGPITVTIINATNGAFNATDVVLTRLNDFEASYPTSATGTSEWCIIRTSRIVIGTLHMYDCKSYSGPPGGTEGVVGEGFIPGGYGAPYAGWPTCSDAETALEYGNEILAYEPPPDWNFNTTTPV